MNSSITAVTFYTPVLFKQWLTVAAKTTGFSKSPSAWIAKAMICDFILASATQLDGGTESLSLAFLQNRLFTEESLSPAILQNRLFTEESLSPAFL